jgi:hypothetical protein
MFSDNEQTSLSHSSQHTDREDRNRPAIERPGINRRSFLARAGVAGVGLAGAAFLAGCGGSSSSSSGNDNLSLNVLQNYEALAVTTYANIISSSIFTSSLSGNSAAQQYWTAAQIEDQIHLNAISAITGAGPSTTSFYYPTGMFTSAQTTLNTLVLIEEALAAGYIIGVNTFSSAANRVLAARILASETEHRSLARVIAADLGLSQVAGLSSTTAGVAGELLNVAPANDFAYPQTFEFASLTELESIMEPFVNSSSASSVSPPFSSTAYSYTAVDVSGDTTYNNISS